MAKAQILDIQSGGDTRALTVDRVGICGIRLPMNFNEGGRSHPSVGEWKCYTDLSAQSRGTHMSRLVRALHDACKGFSYDTFRALPEKVIQCLSDASRCELSVNFDCFIEKRAPVSEEVGYIDCQTAFYARQSRTEKRFLIRVTTPVTSLCPCSKAISKHGAHNQRSHLSLTLEPDSGARVRDIVALIESCASCDLYSMLKRADEQHVTERAYDNPKFVEDMARDLAVAVEREIAVRSYRVEAENFESIHNHSAYAMITSSNFPADMLI